MRESDIQEKFMKQALELALKGKGNVEPNPMVGAVLVREDEVISRGYHQKFGQEHAEVNLLSNLKKSGRGIEGEDVLYVSLEPCSHYGKTPPCAQAIVDAGIRKVVVAMQDPNPLVSGRGIEILRSAGVSVHVGLLEDEARRLNRYFIKQMTTNLPYCRAKWAMTLDGKMAADTGDSAWISSKASRVLVHVWRNESDAVLVGAGTVERDDPLLTVRHIDGGVPYRVVLDTNCRISLDAKLLNDAHVMKTIIITSRDADARAIDAVSKKGAAVQVVDTVQGRVDLRGAFEKLRAMGIESILCESGPVLQGQLLEAGLIDEVATFISPKIIGGSIHSPFSSIRSESMTQAVELDDVTVTCVETDVMITGMVRKG